MLSINAKIIEHMIVVAADGQSIGKVDHMQDGRIKLTKDDSPDGTHHFIPLTWVADVGTTVRLNKTLAEIKTRSAQSSTAVDAVPEAKEHDAIPEVWIATDEKPSMNWKRMGAAPFIEVSAAHLRATQGRIEAMRHIADNVCDMPDQHQQITRVLLALQDALFEMTEAHKLLVEIENAWISSRSRGWQRASTRQNHNTEPHSASQKRAECS